MDKEKIKFDITKEQIERVNNEYYKHRIIGSNQKIYEPEIIQEAVKHFNTLNYENTCPVKKYDWAEIKSSLLIDEFIKDKNAYDNLANFVIDMNKNIVKEMHKDFKSQETIEYPFKLFEDRNAEYLQMVKYYNYLKTILKENDQQLQDIREYLEDLDDNFYPISQQNNFDIRKFRNDFYVQFNFSKFLIWNYQEELEYTKQILRYDILIEDLRNHIAYIINYFRGRRFNVNDIEAQKNDQVGITNIKIDRLKRIVNGKTSKWIHPGKARCFVPYRSGYGRYLKQNQNTYYGSRLCGESGSTQFITYNYLYSLLNYDLETLEKKDYSQDLKNVFCTSCFIMTGDGGHNVKESLYGEMISLIFLKKIIDICLDQNLLFSFFKNMFINIYKYIDEIPGTIKDEIIKLKMIYEEIFKKIRPFLNYFYDSTRNINFMHLTESQDKEVLENFIKEFMTENKVENENNIYYYILNHENYTQTWKLQCLFALDSDRYKISEADNNANFEKFTRSMFSDKYDKSINEELDKIKEKCKSENIEIVNIPFAYKY